MREMAGLDEPLGALCLNGDIILMTVSEQRIGIAHGPASLHPGLSRCDRPQ